MLVQINGLQEEIGDISLEELIKMNDWDASKVVVELNGQIVQPLCYGQTRFNEGDCVEIVQFVGGG